MHPVAYMTGYIQKEAEAPVDQSPTVKDLLRKSKGKRSIFWNAIRDSGRLEALGEASGKDVSFNVRHPILSDLGVGLAGSAAGGYVGHRIGDILGGYGSKMLGMTLGSGIGSLLAVLALRKMRQGEVEDVGESGARVDPERIKKTLKRIGGGFALTRGARNFILPGLGMNEGGYVEMAEAMKNPNKRYKSSKGEALATGLTSIPTIPTQLGGGLIAVGSGIGQGHSARKKAQLLTGDDPDSKFRAKIEKALAQKEAGEASEGFGNLGGIAGGTIGAAYGGTGGAVAGGTVGGIVNTLKHLITAEEDKRDLMDYLKAAGKGALIGGAIGGTAGAVGGGVLGSKIGRPLGEIGGGVLDAANNRRGIFDAPDNRSGILDEKIKTALNDPFLK
jgi:hypothetical protein